MAKMDFLTTPLLQLQSKTVTIFFGLVVNSVNLNQHFNTCHFVSATFFDSKTKKKKQLEPEMLLPSLFH